MGQNCDQAKCDDTFWPVPNILMASVLADQENSKIKKLSIARDKNVV